MKKVFLFMILIYISCGPDPIPDPESVNLVAPNNLESCTTASRVNDLERQVRFQWTAALNTDQYELIIENTLTNQQFRSTTYLLNVSVILPAGAPYRWFVRSKASLTKVTADSQTWSFYLEDSPEESHFPFPAKLISPENNSTVSLNLSGEVLFSWQAKDLDEDIESYQLYIGSSEDQLSIKRDGILHTQTSEILEENSEYFWQVITIDENQNQSRSKVFSFQTD